VFFHIDESGNTGNNLFDNSQPWLSYGVLSSSTNVDALGIPLHKAMLSRLGVEALHASPLGEERIEKISPLLLQLQKKMRFEFGYYFIEKRTYALVQLFEAVFDAGLNEAVPWIQYWTPMRFLLIHQLSTIVDEDLLQKSWALCSAKRIERNYAAVVELLTELRRRTVELVSDQRLNEVFLNAFDYGIRFPEKLDFGTSDPKIISPNAIGFQFVVAHMARLMRNKDVRRVTAITLDYQQQFNSSQLKTHHYQHLISQGLRNSSHKDQDVILNHPLYAHLSRKEILGHGIPNQLPTVSRSAASIGLQIVDLYLWIMNRVVRGNGLPAGILDLASAISKKTYYDGVSMQGMQGRWEQFENELPAFERLSKSDLERATNMIEAQRTKVSALGLSRAPDSNEQVAG
jgi:hypothetical protein